jgi:hypothetical protein
VIISLNLSLTGSIVLSPPPAAEEPGGGLGPELIANGSFPGGDYTGWSETQPSITFGDAYMNADWDPMVADAPKAAYTFPEPDSLMEGATYRLSIYLIDIVAPGGDSIFAVVGGDFGSAASGSIDENMVGTTWTLDIGPIGAPGSNDIALWFGTGGNFSHLRGTAFSLRQIL